MAWRTELAWACASCDGVSLQSELLVALHPFAPYMEVHGCPECKEMDLVRACDWDSCNRHMTSGTPTPGGYRMTCHEHRPPAALKKGAGDEC